MSKKNKKKLRKILRQQAQQAVVHENRESGVESKVVSVNGPVESRISEKEITPNTTKMIQTEDAKEVKHEIRKILLTMLILFAIIVGVYFINIKTDFILKFGEWATNLLNINV